MGAFTAVAITTMNFGTTEKTCTFPATGPASYDAGGSTIDLSTATLGAWTAFTKLYDALVMAPVTAPADDKYEGKYVIAASNAPATGKIKIRDQSAASDAEASGDLSTVTVTLTVRGV